MYPLNFPFNEMASHVINCNVLGARTKCPSYNRTTLMEWYYLGQMLQKMNNLAEDKWLSGLLGYVSKGNTLVIYWGLPAPSHRSVTDTQRRPGKWSGSAQSLRGRSAVPRSTHCTPNRHSAPSECLLRMAWPMVLKEWSSCWLAGSPLEVTRFKNTVFQTCALPSTPYVHQVSY